MKNNNSSTNNPGKTHTHQYNIIKYKFAKLIKFVKNNVINSDGLTLMRVFQAFVKMLDGDLKLVQKVLTYANFMAEHGVKLANESQLKRNDVLLVLEKEKQNLFEDQVSIKKPTGHTIS